MKRKSSNTPALGDLVRDFFHWLVSERNVSPNTIAAYRDTMVLFLRYLADVTRQTVDQLMLDDDLGERVVAFLNYLEQTRKIAIATRNHRLSALKSFCRYVAYAQPLLASACRRVTLIPLKKRAEKLVEYLEAEEMEAIIAVPDRTTVEGRRDHALLLLLFNTGCRVSESIQLTRESLLPGPPRHVRILGKGRRWRTVPLWERTIKAVEAMLQDRKDDQSQLFLGQRGMPLTRFGVRHLLDRHCAAAAKNRPALSKKHVSPHTVRHTTAVALLRATGDLDGVSKVLGHASLNTTRLYTAADRSRLAQTLNSISSALVPAAAPDWKPDPDLIAWLERL
jgi:site-specific recombinase XerD